LAVPVMGGYFNDDLAAILAGAKRDGFFYDGVPVTPGFSSIRQPSEAVSIVLLLDNGQTVVGDGMSVAYSGAGGRIGRFSHASQLLHLRALCEHLEERRITKFLSLCDTLEEEFDQALHKPPAMYAISQALLQAVAIDQKVTCAEVLASELGVEVSETAIPIYVQCGDHRQENVDKAILKQAGVLPHGLINDILTTLGCQGELLSEYVSWIVGRIKKYGREGYHPEIHIDVYGLIGQIFDHDVEKMAIYVAGLGKRAKPYDLCLETPVLMQSREAQIDLFGSIHRALQDRNCSVKLIVDEWANDLEDIRVFASAGVTDMINVKSPDLGAISNTARAILECWASGVRPILGGSCTDTDQSARTMCHVALATRPAWLLARPGMGIDEGMQIVHNEMVRTLSVIQARKEMPASVGPVRTT